MGTKGYDWLLELAHDQWVVLPVSGPQPSARYKHAATLIDEKLYVVGGSRHGRYLSDIQVFDLRNLAWSTIKLNLEPNTDNINSSQEVFSAISGHNMIKWENKLLLFAGHSKSISDSVTVRFIDLESHQCGVIETFGKVPVQAFGLDGWLGSHKQSRLLLAASRDSGLPSAAQTRPTISAPDMVARGGQSVSLVGSRLIMFGGEDMHRRLLNDVHILNLETMTWDVAEITQTPPAPRFDHTATVHSERYLLIFGGCSHSIFFNDLHVLDLETMQWSQPQIQGDLVTPRAGHASITIDENWYMVGGGDNKSGCPETLVLNMSKLVLSVLTTVKGRDPLASEGLTLSAALIEGEKFLVAFGGYNGTYNNEVFVMKPKPTNSSHPKIFQSPAAAAAAASVTAAYALTKPGKLDFAETEDSNNKADLSVEINGIREAKKVMESSLVDFRAETSALKAKLEETNTTYADLSKELHSVQGQLVAERSRCANLEAQISELQKMLVSIQSIEEEVHLLRSQKSAFEQDMEFASAGQRQNSGGVWRWIAG
ncbi:hypothetical protein LguiA_031971 [Lonicera macranthoides]